jgi:RecA-family ATPase
MSTGNGRDLHTMSVRELQQHTRLSVDRLYAGEPKTPEERWARLSPEEQAEERREQEARTADALAFLEKQKRDGEDKTREQEEEPKSDHQHNGKTHHGRKGDAKPATLVVRNASQIEMRHIEWIWPGRVAIGKHTAIAGDPGVSKSTLLLGIAATVTRGGEWPCGEGASPKGSVVILSAEDDAADTIVPRLRAAGADLGKVHIVTAVKDEEGSIRTFNLQADLAQLGQKIAEIGDVRLAVIDPISSYMGKVDSHKNSESRGVIEPLSEMASRLRVAILSNTHFSKAGAANKSRALHRFIGSIAFVGAPRAAFAIIQDSADETRRLMLHVKNNIAPKQQGLAYTLEEAVAGYTGDREAVFATRIVWAAEPVETTADEAIAATEASLRANAAPAAPDREEAKRLLQDLLANGKAMSPEEIQAEAKEAGISWATVRRAKSDLGVVSERQTIEGKGAVGPWQWRLPDAHPEATCSRSWA